MRSFNKSLVLLASLTLPTVAVAQQELTIVSWGGAYTKSQEEAYHKPYTGLYGTKINNVDKGSEGPAGIRAQVAAGQVTWDLVDIIEPEAARLCDEGLVEEIDYDSLLAPGLDGSKPSDDFLGGLNGCFIPTIVYSTLFAYNKDVFGNKAPQSVRDVFDLKRFPGKRALEKQPYNNLEWALLASGVPVSKLYEVLSTRYGVLSAFKKLDTIKDQVIWWTAGSQSPQLLADREVSIATGFNGRFFDAIVVEKQPIAIMWTGQAVELDGWVVPKGQLTAEVKRYLYFATDAQRLADQAKYISYGPMRKSSEPLVGSHAKTGVDMAPHMPTAAANIKDAYYKSAEFWTDNGEVLTERFNAWLAK